MPTIVRKYVRTGKLRQDITFREERAPGSYMIVFYSTLAYARFVLGGTAPHVITARNARALRWVANSGHGPVRFARSVNHPGTKPDPFPERAMPKIGPALGELFARACKEAAEL